ncbi:Bug family tripartite tricarboxylate transporter substrate binding protein [Alcaligenes endophyticus]|uniref:Tripartite tricarboxylate transporter substrate binding protein n=1 Tax=Alcaligenes endophyticus TaxID=1929088 RepID=A0ABT8EKI8_9BURK|nr:tripartite tricarboxylate transporter substrate binding protein [Alcaligenes endophyticus]MCX5590814.1 tripartite tricarboxylate transporter substrate binding protein [Alcaligenes endophyticus]MDN4121823.1 tripartite tricarboxylate transporter substrate binding protein [Alcaligenes endophyticus]
MKDKTMRVAKHVVLAGLLGLSTIAAAQASDYPNRPVTMVVPFSPGSITDVLARLAAKGLGDRTGGNFVVVNKPGAGGNIGAAEVAMSKPDGYTLLVGAASTNAINPSLFKNLRFDPIKDFIPISNLAKTANVLVVAPDVEAQDLPEFIDLVRKQEITYGSTGNGGSMHLSGELFKTMVQGQMLHIPYKGGSEALSDLLPGRVQAMFCNIPLCLPHIEAGKLRALAVTTKERSALLPAVPTMAESGLPEYDVYGWFGLFAPTGTDAAIIEKLNTEMQAILGDADIKVLLLQQGAEPDPSTPEAYAEFVQHEHDKWAQVIEEAGIVVE